MIIVINDFIKSDWAEGELNIEKLIDIVPRNLISRVSLFNLINEAERSWDINQNEI